MNLKQHLFFVTAQIAGLLSAEKKNTVGGQALIEGVMMRGKEKISLAVRRGPDDILIEEENFVSVTK